MRAAIRGGKNRARIRGMGSRASADEFVSHAMYCAEMYGARRVLLQFLAEFENVIVDGPRRRIVLVAPDFVQQFVAADDPVGVLYEELEGLELLRGQDY